MVCGLEVVSERATMESALCLRHFNDWVVSGELRRQAGTGVREKLVAIADFVRRVQAEERNGCHG